VYPLYLAEVDVTPLKNGTVFLFKSHNSDNGSGNQLLNTGCGY